MCFAFVMDKYNRDSVDTFLYLVKAGLWESQKSVQGYYDQEFKYVNWREVYQLAEDQSVIGLVAAGIEAVQGEWLKVHGSPLVPQDWALQFIGQTLQIEQRNKEMNVFVAKLVEELRKAGVYALLVKGQGIAQCYKKPLWRSSGDIDLLLNKANYLNAVSFLTPFASDIKEEKSRFHNAMTIDGWIVELHGTLKTNLWKKLDKQIDCLQDDIFMHNRVREWDNNGCNILLPSPDEDIVLVFCHILQHFYKEGIGLRQICDWCRLMWVYRDNVNIENLESWITKMDIKTEWKAFAVLAVEYLGMPEENVPMYDKRFKRKSARILALVLEAGNFGHNKDLSYHKKYSFLVYKTISFLKHTLDNLRFALISPVNSIKVWCGMIKTGLSQINS